MTCSDQHTDELDEKWSALLRLPVTETEVAFVPTPEAETDQIVVIYNARHAPPVVTIDADHSAAIYTLCADGAPLAVLSRDPAHVPSPNDVVLVARHMSSQA